MSNRKILFIVSLILGLCSCKKMNHEYPDYSNLLNQSCSYANDHDHYNVSEARNDARTSFSAGKYYLILVADGIGPSTPGLEVLKGFSSHEASCFGLFLQKAEHKILNVGADHEIMCRESLELSKKATTYAKDYNQEVITLLMEQGEHICEKPH